MDKKNFGMDCKREETTTRKTTNEMGRCVHMDGQAERSAENESDLSSTSSTTLLDDGSERANRMEVMLWPYNK
ncbi:hypothetical protein Y032_0023g723 [Ancylostoma ceylanicum]|uniref:Uncharacterized protein n=1 Tax=Ancylostoma ceylanicum TaxID=53326 RepID=A0A016UX58_9BILA|nr:hypothetical protein Y032_0023g723 [Ancylostoma ceylanicum]